MQEIDTSLSPTTQAVPPPRLDVVLGVISWVLGVTLVLFVAWFGYTVWATQKADRAGNPALRAVDALMVMARKNPNDIAVRIRLGEALASAGQNDEAVVQLQQALKIDPKHTGAYLDLGLLAAQEQEWKSADSYFRRVVDLTEGSSYENINSQREQALFYLGEIALTERRYEDAVSWFKASLRIRRDAADTYLNLALAYKGIGDYGAALKQLDAAIAFDKNYAQAYYEMGQVYAAKKDTVNAAINYAKAAQLDSAADQPKEAIAALGTAEEWRAKALAALKANDLNEAADDVLVARVLAPKDASLVKLNAQIAEKKGDPKAALSIWKVALELAPNDPDIKAAIKRLSTR